jgi:hypothetical protein
MVTTFTLTKAVTAGDCDAAGDAVNKRHGIRTNRRIRDPL